MTAVVLGYRKLMENDGIGHARCIILFLLLCLILLVSPLIMLHLHRGSTESAALPAMYTNTHPTSTVSSFMC